MLRFEANPMGDMNIDDLQLVLFNYMVSKQKNEDLVIRINNTNNEKQLMEILNLFGIEYKFIVNKNDNLKHHSQFAMQLLIEKKAYNCFCGDEILQKEKDEAIKNNIAYKYSGFCKNLSDSVTFECDAPFTVRLKEPKDDIVFTDLINGKFTYKADEIDNFIILNHDKTPTNDFSCSINDMLSDISIVIQKENELENIHKQIHIRNSLSYNKDIIYAHIPVIKNANDFKINKLIEDGFLPASIANYLVLLAGFSNTNEIFTIEEALEFFDISKISKKELIFDIEKLKYINNKHIEIMDELRLSKILSYSDKDIGFLAKLYLQECDTIKQLKEKIDNIFSKKDKLDKYYNEFNSIKNEIKNLDFIDNYNEFEQELSKKTNLQGKNLQIPLRYILTKELNGPALCDIYKYIKNYLGEIAK